MKVIELLKSKEWSGKVIDCVLRFALSFALAGAQVFGGYAPLALGMIGASGAGLRGVSALIGASAGAVLFLPFSHALRTFAAGVLIFTANNAFFDLKLYKKRAFLPLLCAGMMFSVEFVYVLRDGVGEAANCLMALLLCALGAMSGRALLSTGDKEKADHPYAPLFILLGVLCGLMAWYFTSMNSRVGGFFKSIDKQYKKWLWGGAILGILIFVFPPLYGEGYEGFTSLMHGNAQELFNNSLFYRFRDIDWVIILFVIATMFFKVIAMSTTNAAGGVGGTFAPSLFVGAFTGASLALVCNTLFGWEVSIVSFTLVGMAGVMSGVMNAPLTSIFLIAELSNGYGLFIPLMITACISFAVDYYLDPDSIYTKQLRQKGELLTHDKDQSVFVFLKLEELMETDFLRIKENMTLGDIVHIISTARRNIFPVIDNFGRLIGVVQLDDLREDMFKHEKYGHPISDYMIPPPDKIIEHEAILSVMEKFEDKHAWMLPVVDKQGRYLGFISKSRILNAYREQLVKIQQ